MTSITMNITATEEFSEYAPTRAEKMMNSTRTGFDGSRSCRSLSRYGSMNARHSTAHQR